MERPGLTRRQALGVGAAAGIAGAASVATEAGAASSDLPLNPPGSGVTPTGGATRAEVLPPIDPGDEVLFYPGIGLVPVGELDGSTAMRYRANPRAGAYVMGGGYLGVAITPPVGSVLRAVDFFMYGEPPSGNVFVDKYQPDNVGYVTNLGTAIISGTTGVAAATVNLGSLQEVYNGTAAYHAYVIGATDVNVVRGIRVRYTPPARGLITISPRRVYDSRLPMTPDPTGALGSGQNRTLSVANGRNAVTGAVDLADVVPATARAVMYTLTLADTFATGYLSVNPGGDAIVKASTINWFGNAQNLANTSVVALGPNRSVTVIAGGGGAAQFVIDIVGYVI